MQLATIPLVIAYSVCVAHSQVADYKLERLGKEALLALKGKRFDRLSRLVHPVKGLRFSPYGTIDISDRILPVKQVALLPKPNNKMLWGEYDANGEPIRLTFSEYYREFIWTKDFTKAPQVEHQKYIGRGNRTLNIARFFPNGHWIEYHFPNSKNLLNWESLRLVFETYNRELKLVAIVHDEWGT